MLKKRGRSDASASTAASAAMEVDSRDSVGAADCKTTDVITTKRARTTDEKDVAGGGGGGGGFGGGRSGSGGRQALVNEPELFAQLQALWKSASIGLGIADLNHIIAQFATPRPSHDPRLLAVLLQTVFCSLYAQASHEWRRSRGLTVRGTPCWWWPAMSSCASPREMCTGG
jgi:hypothetical protein